jgi:hypothetical protein
MVGAVHSKEFTMKRLLTLATMAAALGLSGLSAQACNPLLGSKAPSLMKLPASLLARNNPNAPIRESVVGLWHVVHTTSAGPVLFEGFDLWHSDGTEEEIPNMPPVTGAICFGVWNQNGKQIQLLTHTTFTYDMNSNWTGTINLTEINKLSKDGNSYKGTFDLKQYDTTGALAGEVTGTSAADRLN